MLRPWRAFIPLAVLLLALPFLPTAQAVFPMVVATVSGTATPVPGSGGEVQNIPFPAGVEKGDLIVAMFVSGTANIPFTFQGDWTQISVRNAALFSAAAAYLNATGHENPSFSVTSTVTSSPLRYIVYRIAVGTHGGVAYGTTSATGVSNAPNPPNLAPGLGVQDFLWLAWESHTGADTCTAFPASYTGGIQVTGAIPGICSAQRALNAASEDPGPFTLSGVASWDAQTLAVQGLSWSYPVFHNSLIKIDTEPAGANCTYGGVKVESGLDDDDDGILDPSEVDSTGFICNGAPGTNGMDGQDGTNGTNGTDGAPGPPGPAGPPGEGLITVETATFLLIIAFALLLLIAYSHELWLVYILAGMVGLLLAFQGFAETGSIPVGIALAVVGLVTLVGGLNEGLSSTTKG